MFAGTSNQIITDTFNFNPNKTSLECLVIKGMNKSYWHENRTETEDRRTDEQHDNYDPLDFQAEV